MSKIIQYSDVQQLFEKMRKAGWNMDQELAWGYFFKNNTIGPLNILAKTLEQQSYDIIDINQSYPDNLYWLQIEKIEQHSIESLDKRNQLFYQIAQQAHILRYDGMDVSPIDI